MNAVASGAAAHGHNEIPRHGFLVATVHRDQADGAAVDQRIAQVARIEADCTIDRRDAHAVAVIAHPGHHSLHDLPGMKHAGGQGLWQGIGRSEAEDIRIADGFGAQAGSQRIADDAAQARVGAAIGLDGRRMVVRLHLEADVETLVKADDAGIILEDADAPVVLGEPAANLLRGPEDGFLKEIVDAPAIEIDLPLQRLVRAMFGPGLGQSFQLGIPGIATQGAEMLLDGLHLGQAQGKLARTADFHQAGIVLLPQLYGDQAKSV